MINIVYLILVITWNSGTATVQVPQANIKQCEINKQALIPDDSVKRAYCIVGVK